MNKAVIIGIIVSAVVIGILVVLSFDSFTNLKYDDLQSEPLLDKGEEDLENDPKSPGRNLFIELDEKMGLSAP